tara:strand:- start:125 stop:268 length:144 start_codon:yes stop_codon:yes gene_type:complete
MKEIIKKYLPYYIFGGSIVVLGVVAYNNRKKVKEFIQKKLKKKDKKK